MHFVITSCLVRTDPDLLYLRQTVLLLYGFSRCTPALEHFILEFRLGIFGLGSYLHSELETPNFTDNIEPTIEPILSGNSNTPRFPSDDNDNGATVLLPQPPIVLKSIEDKLNVSPKLGDAK